MDSSHEQFIRPCMLPCSRLLRFCFKISLKFLETRAVCSPMFNEKVMQSQITINSHSFNGLLPKNKSKKIKRWFVRVSRVVIAYTHSAVRPSTETSEISRVRFVFPSLHLFIEPLKVTIHKLVIKWAFNFSVRLISVSACVCMLMWS